MSDNLKNSEDDGANAASDDDTRIPMADEILDDEEELATTEEESNAAANTGGGPDRYLSRSLRRFETGLYCHNNQNQLQPDLARRRRSHVGGTGGESAADRAGARAPKHARRPLVPR